MRTEPVGPNWVPLHCRSKGRSVRVVRRPDCNNGIVDNFVKGGQWS